MFNFKYLNACLILITWITRIYFMVIQFLYMMTSKTVVILLLPQYKTLQTSNANEEIAVGFCLFSLSTGVEVFDEKCWTAWDCSQRKSFGYFLDKIHLISVHVQEKLLWLQISSSCKIPFWIAIETLSTSFINISLHYSTKVHRPRMVLWIYGDNSASLTARAHVKRSWSKRWKYAQSDRTLKRILACEITVSWKRLWLVR